MDNMDQLDILKEEMAALKRSLDKEQIVNDKLMRTVMRQRASWLNTFVKAEFILLPVIWALLAIICAGFHISLWYANIFIILGAIDTALDWRTMRIPQNIFSTYSMVEMKKFLVKQKKERKIQTLIATPLGIIYLLLFFNALHSGVSDDIRLGGFIGGIIGTVIALPIVIIIYNKAQKTNDTILNEIEEE